MPDIYLYPGEASPNDIRLSDPTVLRSAGGFDAATFTAIQQLSDGFRNVRNRSLYQDAEQHPVEGSSGGITVYFDPAALHWGIVSDRTLSAVHYLRQDWPDVAWLAQPAPIVGWTAPTDRMARPLAVWKPDTNSDNAWIYSTVPVVGWTAPTDRMARAVGRWTQETNADNAWIFQNLPILFDPASQVWAIPAERMGHALARWTQETNPTFGWITPELVLVFDPALFPSIAELVGDRTPAMAQLRPAYYLSLYDLSWVHDVIPLTDPPAGAFIHIRPIAPIMSARRRNKRRR